MTREIQVEHRGRVARAEIRTTASADRVWQAWAEPARLSEWFTDRAQGRAAAGGTVVWCFDRFKSRFPYDVMVADEAARLVLKGTPPGRPPYLLEVLLGEDEARGTLVRVINSGF